LLDRRFEPIIFREPYIYKFDIRRFGMDLSRKIGIGVVMVVPTFVGSGAVWGIFSSYIAVFIWVVIMAFLYGGILSGKILSA
jgi:hypothetical protein